MAGKLFGFRESAHFTHKIVELLSDDEYSKLQNRLIDFPDAGDLINRSGGLRRSVRPRKGKVREADRD